jgi:hypothetical protein
MRLKMRQLIMTFETAIDYMQTYNELDAPIEYLSDHVASRIKIIYAETYNVNDDARIDEAIEYAMRETNQ